MDDNAYRGKKRNGLKWTLAITSALVLTYAAGGVVAHKDLKEKAMKNLGVVECNYELSPSSSDELNVFKSNNTDLEFTVKDDGIKLDNPERIWNAVPMIRDTMGSLHAKHNYDTENFFQCINDERVYSALKNGATNLRGLFNKNDLSDICSNSVFYCNNELIAKKVGKNGYIGPGKFNESVRYNPNINK